MLLKKSNVKKILVVSLTNIGDVILTLPIMDILRHDFPSAEISIVIGPKAKSLFDGNTNLKVVHVYNKHQSPMAALKWVWSLFCERFDLIVDLKNTAIPILAAPRYSTSLFFKKRDSEHMKDKHLRKLASVYNWGRSPISSILDYSINRAPSPIMDFPQKKFAVVAPGSAFGPKRWREDGFAQVCDELKNKYSLEIVFIGDQNDKEVAKRIQSIMKIEPANLCGQMTLIQLAALLKKSSLALVNDSAPMHMASYFNVPTVALFGPSDPVKYGPWGEKSSFVRSDSDDISRLMPNEVMSSVDKIMELIDEKRF